MPPPDAAVAMVRARARRALDWLTEHGPALGQDPLQIAAVRPLLEAELALDLSDLEPRPALFALIELPRAAARWERRRAKAPGDAAVKDERQRLARALEPFLTDLPKKQVRTPRGTRVLAFFEPRPRAQDVSGLALRYPSFWDHPFIPDEAGSDAAPASAVLALGAATSATRASTAWASLRFAEHYVEALRRPDAGWPELWAQQKALIEAGLPTPRLREQLGGDVSVRALLRLLDEVSPASDDETATHDESGAAIWDGMHDTPFFVGRVAALLGPPPESWGGGDFDLEVERRGERYGIHVGEGAGHGIRSMEGTSEDVDPSAVEVLLVEVANAILAAPDVRDALALSFHGPSADVFEVGARERRLVQRRARTAPFWVGQFWRSTGSARPGG